VSDQTTWSSHLDFLAMLARGDEMAVAWDRDVDQSLVTNPPRLYYLSGYHVVWCAGSNDTHARFRYDHGRWVCKGPLDPPESL